MKVPANASLRLTAGEGRWFAVARIHASRDSRYDAIPGRVGERPTPASIWLRRLVAPGHDGVWRSGARPARARRAARSVVSRSTKRPRSSRPSRSSSPKESAGGVPRACRQSCWSGPAFLAPLAARRAPCSPSVSQRAPRRVCFRTMNGRMMNFPLTLTHLVDRAARYHGDREVVVRQAGQVAPSYDVSRGECALREARLGPVEARRGERRSRGDVVLEPSRTPGVLSRGPGDGRDRTHVEPAPRAGGDRVHREPRKGPRRRRRSIALAIVRQARGDDRELEACHRRARQERAAPRRRA